ncbi:hypothetical protein ACFQX6_05630 [Streptosporangium lutulentum]
MPAALRTVVSDPLGQAHLTALGVLIGIERVLGLDGALPPGAGVVLPETAIDPVRALSRLRAFGVGITTVPSRRPPRAQRADHVRVRAAMIGSRSRRGVLIALDTGSRSEFAGSNPGPGSIRISGTGTAKPQSSQRPSWSRRPPSRSWRSVRFTPVGE